MKMEKYGDTVLTLIWEIEIANAVSLLSCSQGARVNRES